MNNPIILNWLNTVYKNTSNLVNSSLDKISPLSQSSQERVIQKKVNASNSNSSKTFASFSEKEKSPNILPITWSNKLDLVPGPLKNENGPFGQPPMPSRRDRDKKQPLFNISSLPSGQSPGRMKGPLSITYEEIGLFPRSFVRVFDRFLKQLFSDVESLVIEEYRFYRYIILTSFKTMLTLLLVPLLINICSKNYIIRPLTEYFWNNKNSEIFLNVSQQKKAFAELQEFEEELYFESFISSSHTTSPLLSSVPTERHRSLSPSGQGELGYETLAKSDTTRKGPNGSSTSKVDVKVGYPIVPRVPGPSLGEERTVTPFSQSGQGIKEDSLLLDSMEHNRFVTGDQAFGTDEDDIRIDSLNGVPMDNSHMTGLHSKFTEKAKELALYYNHQSIEAITNFLGDLLGLLTLCYLILTMKIQINITKAFLTEFFFGLEDSKKSLIILLVTDLLVGYHSPHLWELFFEFLLDYYGFPQTETGIELLVATIPPVLDVLFKYLIFRHLNRTSPATVATYNAMIE